MKTTEATKQASELALGDVLLGIKTALGDALFGKRYRVIHLDVRGDEPCRICLCIAVEDADGTRTAFRPDALATYLVEEAR